MAKHLASTHILSFEVDVLLPVEISFALPLLDALPRLFYKCPHSDCTMWYPAKGAVNVHINKEHGTYRTKSPYRKQYAQRLYVYNYPEIVSHTFILPKDWNSIIYLPPPQIFPTVSQPKLDVAPSEARYLRETG